MTDQTPNQDSKAGAGFAGAGGGTLVAVIASNLPDDSTVKPYLLIAAPSVAIFFSGLWLWLNVKVSNYLRDREVKSVIASARQTLQEALDNPHTTKGHQNNLRKEMEKLELLALGHHMKRIESIKVFTEEDVRPDST